MHYLELDEIECEIDERVLFKGLSTRIESGELVQVAGPNGSGKTTLLKILTGISSHYSGSLSWCRHRVPSYEFYTDLLYFGHLPGVKTSLTPMENLQWYFGINGPKGEEAGEFSRDQLIAALAKVGLAGYEDIPAFQMSAGQQRRVGLARLYLSQAPLWVLDEPFTAIDKQGVADLEQTIETHRNSGGIVILTSHQSLIQANPKLIDLGDYCGSDA